MSTALMEPCYEWYDAGIPVAGQSEAFRSFIGGRPAIPPATPLPVCALCGAGQTFFFQVAFPEHHSWGGLSVALFACTRCADERHLIPPMLDGPLDGADIPAEFLETPPPNHRAVVFPTSEGRPRADYTPVVAFRAITLRSAAPGAAANKVGGEPTWILGEEAPASYAGRTPMTFLLQLLPATRFDVVPGAPPQWTIGFDGRPAPTGAPYYELFIGNAVYLFGTARPSRPLVYVLTQVD